MVVLYGFMRFYGIYPLVTVYITLERSTIFNVKTHSFNWAIFKSYVILPEGSQGQEMV